MSRDEQPEETPLKPLIELEALPETSCGETSNDNPPIPEKPAHICPSCDYNLTGLTSRRCPECGEEFLLYEARWHAVEIGAQGEEIRRVRRRNKVLLILGISAGVLGVAIPVADQIVSRLTATGQTTWVASPHCHVAPLILVLVLMKYYREWRWSSVVFMIGIVFLLCGLVMVL